MIQRWELVDFTRRRGDAEKTGRQFFRSLRAFAPPHETASFANDPPGSSRTNPATVSGQPVFPILS